MNNDTMFESERKESNLHNESQILTHYRYATLRVKFPILTNKELQVFEI